MKCDVETVEADLLALVQAKLPDKIAEITAEKADGIVLTVPANTDYINTTDDEVNNTDLIVHYGITDGVPLSIGSNTAEDNRYVFNIYLDELNQQPGIVRKKLFRYIRALKEIFEENFKKFSYLSSMKVETIAPGMWQKNEQSPIYKVGGVYIETSLAG